MANDLLEAAKAGLYAIDYRTKILQGQNTAECNAQKLLVAAIAKAETTTQPGEAIKATLDAQLVIAKSDFEEAKKYLAAAAQAMANRGKEAVRCAELMLAGEPTSTMWVDFAEGDWKRAKEAKDGLERAVEKVKMLEWLIKSW